MRKQLIILISILSISTTILAQQYGSFKDSRDGKVYKTVKISEQVWLAENLDVVVFNNGDTIPEAKSDKEWEEADKKKNQRGAITITIVLMDLNMVSFTTGMRLMTLVD